MAILAINMSLIRSIMYDGKEGERRLRTMTERMYTWTRREGGRGGRERREGEEGKMSKNMETQRKMRGNLAVVT